MNSEMLADRIKQCADMAGSGDALAQKAAIPRRTLETYLSGQSEPKTSRLVAIAKAADVSVEWLATGEGPKRPDEIGEAPAQYDLTPGADFALVPVYDVIASAGHGAAIDQEQTVSQIAFRKDWLRVEGLSAKGLAAISAHGDSMVPTIQPGALLLVDSTQRTISNDSIYIVRRSEHLYAKRLQQMLDGSVCVISDNKIYKEEVISSSGLGNLDIIGRVVWIGQKI
ncbi:MAG: helix-turn-helix transcriptional regulator [Chromatiales bacterium]|nr:helix-turn-helix transcriptional regulator [Gammaproteobacteria bacterium]